MADIRKFNSILNAKATGFDILRLGESRYYPGSNALAPLKQDLAEFASKKDFFAFCESLQRELLSKTISKENFIAKGAQGKVYRVPGTNCAVKVPLDCVSIPIKPISKNISPQEKTNYVIAKIGENVDIIKFIDGKNVHQLVKRGIPVSKTVLNMPHEAYTNYIEKLMDAAKVNMFHDFGGANTLLNEKYRFMVPIDFHSSLTRKANPVEDLYFQFGNYMKNAREENTLLAKSALAFVDMIRTNKINSALMSKTEVSLSKVESCFMPQDRAFFYEVESKLKKIAGLKRLESISPDVSKSLEEEILKFNDYIIGILIN